VGGNVAISKISLKEVRDSAPALCNVVAMEKYFFPVAMDDRSTGDGPLVWVEKSPYRRPP
jgi:hypothetical protein